METSMKGVTSGKVRLGLTKTVGAFYHRVVNLPSQNALPAEIFACGVPYEVSRTYRTMKSEIELKRSTAMFEVNRQILRGL